MKLTRRNFARLTSSTLAVRLLSDTALAENAIEADVCIYGATASGIAVAKLP